MYTFFFFLMIRRPPRSPPFPSTTLFRSLLGDGQRVQAVLVGPQQQRGHLHPPVGVQQVALRARRPAPRRADRKSTRLNSSHANISYAVFCLKKKQHTRYTPTGG